MHSRANTRQGYSLERMDGGTDELLRDLDNLVMHMGIALMIFLIVMMLLQVACYIMMLRADKISSTKLYKIIDICAYITITGMILVFILMVVFGVLMFIP